VTGIFPSQIRVGHRIRNVQPAEEIALEPAGTDASRDSRTGAWFDALFREHYPRMVGMLARLTGDRGHAEEIAADVFCKLARRPALLQSRDQLTAWAWPVATNAGLDALRLNSRRRKWEQAAGAESLRASEPAGALDEMLRNERCARVRTVLAALKPRDAQLLLLRSSGLAYRELAQTLGIEARSVGTLLARAEQAFERKFRMRYGDEV
jgi:RNA polymerase sigma-70 factor (ECF subfamily)